MSRLSAKTKVVRSQTSSRGLPSEFNKDDFDAQSKSRGYKVIHEKAYICPCKDKQSTFRNTCHNCGGTGWIFANPTETYMIVTGIMSDDEMKAGGFQQWGNLESGAVKITALNDDKLGFMDRITILDATAENNQVLYPVLNDAGDQLFAYTRYNIEDIDYIALFNTEQTPLTRLTETTDYTYHDNVIIFDSSYNGLSDPCVTIRYVHNPVFHVVDILRESITSPNKAGVKQKLPVQAVGRRAHLITDIENFDGDRLIDNSWKPTCDSEEYTQFQRALRHTSAQDIYDSLTDQQRIDLALLLP